MEKSRILIVGGTGYIGRRIVQASLAQGHPTLVLMRPEIGLDIDKLQMLLSFKAQGARLAEASLDDHAALVAAVAQADVVVSAMSGVHFRSHNLLLQHKLVEAIKEAGNVKRFIPSEFGIDPSRMGHALEPGRVTFDEKMELRRAIEEANIPHTYISANCFAAYFCPNLCQMGTLLPPKEKVHVYGDGNVKVIFCDEDDVATYTINSIDDPRTLNKTMYLRPQENILTQNDMIAKWEKLSGKVLEKIHVPADELLASMKGNRKICSMSKDNVHSIKNMFCVINDMNVKNTDLANQVGVTHFYHIFYEGCTANFEIGEDGAEATLLYPEVQYTRMDEYMKIYL
ncbi:Isoflavone reductase-like protein [Dichanthelium oligosanthes]|uniref:Isoflavone reductase-like protein n=1 Tax=Dichanthelium oligosanthes TaxID=888268 RepID=A0A1E5V0N7_9POAL|nr:Isoflavone reductase-like protein [Dichanthelium oligosanthes]